MDEQEAKRIVDQEIELTRAWFDNNEGIRNDHIFERLEGISGRYFHIAIERFNQTSTGGAFPILVSKYFSWGFIDFLRRKNDSLVANAIGLFSLNPEAIHQDPKFYEEYKDIYDGMLRALEQEYNRCNNSDDYIVSLYEKGKKRHPRFNGATMVLCGNDDWSTAAIEDKEILADMVEEKVMKIKAVLEGDYTT